MDAIGLMYIMFPLKNFEQDIPGINSWDNTSTTNSLEHLY